MCQLGKVPWAKGVADASSTEASTCGVDISAEGRCVSKWNRSDPSGPSLWSACGFLGFRIFPALFYAISLVGMHNASEAQDTRHRSGAFG